MRRPLVIITAVYCGGLALARLLFPLSRELFFILAVLTLMIFACLFFSLPRRFPQVSPVFSFLPFFCLLALFNYQAAAARFQGNLSQFAGERVALEGLVTAEPVIYADRALYILEAEKVTLTEGRSSRVYPARGRVRLVVEHPQKGEAGHAAPPYFLYGDRLLVQGKLALPTGPRNPGGFDDNKFLLSQGAGAQLYLSFGQGQVLPPAAAPGIMASTQKTVFKLKNRTLAAFHENLSFDEAALLGGILFGLRSGLPPRVEENFRGAGVSHLLAVSGLHVGLVAWLAMKILGLMRVKGEGALLGSLPVVAAFALITGFRPAVLRALFMFIFLALAQLLGRDRDFLSALSLAALISLLLNPFFLFTPGFQLSYAGIACIVYLYEDFKGFFAFLPPMFQGIAAASLTAQLGVAPLTAYYFQQVSLIALLTNLILVACMTAVLGGGLVGAVLVSTWPLGGGLALKLVSPLLTFFLAITEAFSALPLAWVEVAFMPLYAVIICYGALLAFANRKRIRPYLPDRAHIKSMQKKIIFGVLLSVCLLAAAGLLQDMGRERVLEVTFLDVGQGASVFILTPAGRSVLVDTGGALFPHSRDPGEDVLIPFLRYKGVKRLDLLIIGHPHVDHYGGAFALVAARRPPRILAAGTLSGEERYRELVRRAEEKGVEVCVVSAGDLLKLGRDLELCILYPTSGQLIGGSAADENNNSLVLKLLYKGVSFLFTGDIEAAGEELLVQGAYNLESTFLQVPHHGSGTSSSGAFLQKVNPAVAVIPVGTNPFGHPAPGVLGRLQAGGITIYRTDWHGAVTIKTDGVRYTIETMLEGPALSGTQSY